MPHLPPVPSHPVSVFEAGYWTTNWAGAVLGILLGALSARSVLKKAGSRLEISAPQLREGDVVEVIVLLPENSPQAKTAQSSSGVLDFLDGLPDGPRSYPSWEEFEHQFQEQRNSWDH